VLIKEKNWGERAGLAEGRTGVKVKESLDVGYLMSLAISGYEII
jgi:hypothetical protein